MLNKQSTHTNRLIQASSPYLLQHAHNPIDWQPWDSKALEKAKNENKLILVSIGYAACHWCHVMERESFEDEVVAELMNEHFVCIKVDREERPDIDQVYMNVVQLVTGRGGWPLNAIALPDGRPIFAGTYFPKENWMATLNHIANLFQNNPAKLEEVAEHMLKGMAKMEWSGLKVTATNFDKATLNATYEAIIQSIDFKEGGTQHAPKFPMPAIYSFLLRYNHFDNNSKALDAVNITLQKMANGGIYDQVGGGFARYSVDDIWKVPHFEKMLYDNGQLVSLYAEAYQVTKNNLYKEVVYETIAFIDREMTSPEGGFYASLDADSEGVEGKFYLWSLEELQKVLGEDADWVADYYNATDHGNWEESNILYVTEEVKGFCARHNIAVDVFQSKLKHIKETLLGARSPRIRPGLDDKILTSWNALMLKGYVDAYKVFDEPHFLEVALKNANFLSAQMLKDDFRLDRNFKNGQSTINAFLDDYSLTIEALIALYQVTFDEQWLQKAKGLMEYVLQHFYDEATGTFFYTSDQDKIVVTRTKEMTDNVIPASNSSIAKSLFHLGLLFYENDYLMKASQMLSNVASNFKTNGAFLANWGILLYQLVSTTYEVAILGAEAEQKRKALTENFLPNVLVAGGKSEGTLQILQDRLVEGQTTLYVCYDKACLAPTMDVREALEQIDS